MRMPLTMDHMRIKLGHGPMGNGGKKGYTKRAVCKLKHSYVYLIQITVECIFKSQHSTQYINSKAKGAPAAATRNFNKQSLSWRSSRVSQLVGCLVAWSVIQMETSWSRPKMPTLQFAI